MNPKEDDGQVRWGYGTHVTEATTWNNRGPYAARVISATNNPVGYMDRDCAQQYIVSTKVQNPSSCYHICDSGYPGANNDGTSYIVWGWNQSMKLRHSGRLNASFVDGHVQAAGPQELVNMGKDNPDFQKADHFFSSAESATLTQYQ